jgi:predicted N-acetyltransferase YhbS
MGTQNDAQYEIRQADPGDAGPLSALAHRSKAHWGYPPEWIEAWAAELTLTPEYLRAQTGFVATTDGVPIGICVLEMQDADAELAHVWIAPEHHGRGIGRRLVERALAAARRSGASCVRVISDPFAEPFYVQLGARRVGDVAAPMPGAEDRILPLLEFRM